MIIKDRKKNHLRLHYKEIYIVYLLTLPAKRHQFETDCETNQEYQWT